ncbi:serine carboxypeptidase-like [Musa troglodytarum]|uniref:Carboxypeptidase n=1 Tax=Musa troglodytarum TaxID=320322 RepID=A0A9E7ID18_9LILI|nr:serine carboxypeptidase-like [Musa troglodytarum]
MFRAFCLELFVCASNCCPFRKRLCGWHFWTETRVPIFLSLFSIKRCRHKNLKFVPGGGSRNMHSVAWRAVVMVAALLQICSSRELESNLSDPNRIIKLPGQPQVSFQQFSGYVTVDERKHRALFYYFAEAEMDPSSKPLVLWLNGGPGCSSVGVGAFSENGPFRPKGEVLVRNEYSWNKEANMLYLETPAGVGFSFSSDSSDYEGVNDQITARDNLVFLQRWFTMFPQYKGRDLYITGESYAGHYVPQLAQLMVDFNKKEKVFNLKGIALGNPVLEFSTDFNSRAEFFWSHGLISDSTYRIFTSACNYSRYQVTERVDVCVEDETVSYLNRKDVQAALHANLIGVTKWTVCSSVIEYELLNLEVPTISIVGSLVKSGIPVLVYSGDQDSVIPLTGSRTLVQRLANELGLKTTIPYRAWFEGEQVGGWTQVYGDVLSFATVRGASHEAPFSQPERSLVLFRAFLQGRPLPETFTYAP